jgi:hypothetical protein
VSDQNQPSQEPSNSRGQQPNDYPEVMEIEATYANWFLGHGTSDGTVRIAFGESFSKDDSFVVGHLAVAMNMPTAVRLYNALGSILQALSDMKTKEMQVAVAKVMAAQNPDGVIPTNKQN